MTPKLSILMPTFNRLAWMKEAIDSVLAEDLDLELLVVDNGSSDGTWAYLQERVRQDPRLRPVRWDVNQIAEVYPALMEMARGEYVNFFADDDAMLPGGLRRKIDILDAQPETGMVFSTVRCMDKDGLDLGEGAWTVIAPEDFPGRSDLFQTLILGNFVPMPAAMFRRALSPTGVILRDTTFLASNDWQFWLDLAVRTRIAFLREPTLRLRLHGGQVTITSGLERGFFVEVNLNVWRHWMLKADPPFIPSGPAWGVMTRTMYAALQTTYGQDMGRIHDGLRRLEALRNEQDARLARAKEAQEAAFPEAFLFEPDWSQEAWRDLVLAYARAFSAPDPVLLVLLQDPARPDPLSPGQRRRAVDEVLSRTGKAELPGVRVLEHGELLACLRDYPHLQRLPGGSALEGAKGERMAAALAQVAGSEQP